MIASPARALGAAAVLTICLGLAQTGHANETAGTTVEAQQQAYKEGTFGDIELSVGSTVQQNARIGTGRFGSLVLEMMDSSRLTVGPNSEMVIDAFVYSPDQSGGEAAVALGKGMLRLVSGRIPSSNIRLDTPVGVVGIRGTDVTLQTQPDGRVRVWLQEGSITVAPSETNQEFPFDAPAFAVCSTTSCERTEPSSLPITFPPSSGSFGNGSSRDPGSSY